MKKPIIYFLSLFLIFLGACRDFDEINTNPNQAVDAEPNVIFPAVTAAFVYGLNGESAQFTSILMQYLTGVLSDQQQVGSYFFLPEYSQTTWNRFYTDCLINIQVIKDKTTESGALHYRGASKIMEAVILAYSVDLWNDIPYSEALNLDEIRRPSYDPGETVYEQAQLLLDEGIDDLNSESTISPSDNDFIFPASSEAEWVETSRLRWIELANGMKARYANRLSKIDPQASATAALAAIDAGTFTSNEDQPEVTFGSEFAGPWFPFFNTSFGENNVAVSQPFVDLLRDRVAPGVDDPRLPFYVSDEGGGLYNATPLGGSKPDNAVVVGPYLNSREAPTPVLNYSEVKFIEAEAALRLNQTERAANAFNEGVSASLLRVTGEVDPDYMAVYGSETAGTLTMEDIYTEKYIDLYLQTEAWNVWRKSIPEGASPTTSGTPNLQPSPNNVTNGAFPRRFLYSQNEVVNNSANVPSVTVLDRVFWDR